jgi:Phage terminase, small subunit
MGCPKPEFLKGTASKIWDRLAPEMIKAGILTPLDGPLLSCYCIVIGELENKGTLDNARLHQLRLLAQSLGGDAITRSRMVAVPPDVGRSADDFFKPGA